MIHTHYYRRGQIQWVGDHTFVCERQPEAAQFLSSVLRLKLQELFSWFRVAFFLYKGTVAFEALWTFSLDDTHKLHFDFFFVGRRSLSHLNSICFLC